MEQDLFALGFDECRRAKGHRETQAVGDYTIRQLLRVSPLLGPSPLSLRFTHHALASYLLFLTQGLQLLQGTTLCLFRSVDVTLMLL